MHTCVHVRACGTARFCAVCITGRNTRSATATATAAQVPARQSRWRPASLHRSAPAAPATCSVHRLCNERQQATYAMWLCCRCTLVPLPSNRGRSGTVSPRELTKSDCGWHRLAKWHPLTEPSKQRQPAHHPASTSNAQLLQIPMHAQLQDTPGLLPDMHARAKSACALRNVHAHPTQTFHPAPAKKGRTLRAAFPVHEETSLAAWRAH